MHSMIMMHPLESLSSCKPVNVFSELAQSPAAAGFQLTVSANPALSVQRAKVQEVANSFIPGLCG